MKTFPIPSIPAGPGGDKPGTPKAVNDAPVKSEGAQTASYAEGGAVLGRTRNFMKEPDPFSAGMPGGFAGGDSKEKKMKADPGSPQDYAGGKPKGKYKADVKTPMPRK